ncbi:hypothetical protein EG349_04790 [Chryseobacterium shandongense]|uniref:Uncharacterized protein n=1 Tax=Chryseobacterium shandongense TaxID=1493872 RepID=A0AAD1DKG7_9FLAO|nr:hypothetical protein EG349_04790 [Chryseobacterium shandongense]AZA94558.1 hypothetical protein EG353_02815 [Chryseobacterium shandongense]
MNDFIFFIFFFCLEIEDSTKSNKRNKSSRLEISAKKYFCSLKILKLARNQHLFFGSTFVSRFKQ